MFNVISCIGWNAVNVIPCAQLLNSVGPLPPWAGCLILVGCTCIFAVFGYKTVHLYEKYSWIPNFIVFMIIIANSLKLMHLIGVKKNLVQLKLVMC